MGILMFLLMATSTMGSGPAWPARHRCNQNQVAPVASELRQS